MKSRLSTWIGTVNVVAPYFPVILTWLALWRAFSAYSRDAAGGSTFFEAWLDGFDGRSETLGVVALTVVVGLALVVLLQVIEQLFVRSLVRPDSTIDGRTSEDHELDLGRDGEFGTSSDGYVAQDEHVVGRQTPIDQSMAVVIADLRSAVIALRDGTTVRSVGGLGADSLPGLVADLNAQMGETQKVMKEVGVVLSDVATRLSIVDIAVSGVADVVADDSLEVGGLPVEWSQQ